MLSKRLQRVLDYINVSDKLADIGCDHGYLALHAIKKGVSFVQLVDNKIGPLNVAKANLSKEELNADIIYSLSNGLSNIDKNINTVAICGMGGDLISSIINENIDVAKRMKHLILEANTKVSILREFLSNNSFKIIDEDVIYDKGKYYEILYVAYTLDCNKLSPKEIEFGPILLRKKSDTFIGFLNYKLDKLNKIILKNDSSINNLEEKIKAIKEILIEI